MQRSLCFCRIAEGDAGDAGGSPVVKAATAVVDASGEEEVVVARLETMEIGELPCSEYCEEGRLLQDGVWLDCSLIIGRGRRRGFCERCGVVGGPWSAAVRNNVVEAITRLQSLREGVVADEAGGIEMLGAGRRSCGCGGIGRQQCRRGKRPRLAVAAGAGGDGGGSNADGGSSWRCGCLGRLCGSDRGSEATVGRGGLCIAVGGRKIRLQWDVAASMGLCGRGRGAGLHRSRVGSSNGRRR
ncbi:hypothetical protein BHE74_00054293 [Ensete ventricosum]|nr:hypothetical protein BHE74_00054293 [Ensete ventricosum]